jgi:DinB family protein
MISTKDLLIKQTAEAFNGRPDMSIMASLKDVTQEEASWRPNETTPTIEQIVRHVAWAKSRYCFEGFGKAMVIADPAVNDAGDHADLPLEFPCGAAWGNAAAPGIDGAIGLLERAQNGLVECLESCTQEALERPIQTHHGKSAAHFFWIMVMHDLYHAGQIRTRRTLRGKQ